MYTFFHNNQCLHEPMTYLSRGQMLKPQEIAARALILKKTIESLGFPIHTPHDHGTETIAKVHCNEYINFLRTSYTEWSKHSNFAKEVFSNIFVKTSNPRGILAKAANHLADGSCPIGPETYNSAYWSAQVALSAAQAIKDGERCSYALCRPPGHHARKDAAGGFCYLNNAAIATEHLKQFYSKIAILDTDMHHGQGTQDIFYERSDVLFVSIHGDPTNYYPVVAGFEDEKGFGNGRNFNINLPIAHNSSESVFFEKLDKAIEAINIFNPEVLVLSLGFDVFEEDPQSVIAFSQSGFNLLGRIIGALKLPTVICQEGGYNLEKLAENATRFFSEFASSHN